MEHVHCRMIKSSKWLFATSMEHGYCSKYTAFTWMGHASIVQNLTQNGWSTMVFARKKMKTKRNITIKNEKAR